MRLDLLTPPSPLWGEGWGEGDWRHAGVWRALTPTLSQREGGSESRAKKEQAWLKRRGTL